MPVLSGKTGCLLSGSSTLEGFENGSLEYGAEPQEYFAKSGAGAAETVAGAESGSGSFQMVCNSEDWPTTLISPGDLVTLSFRHDGTTTVEATGSARLGKFSWEMNRDGTPQRVTIPFVTHGSWTFPS